jgi:kinesin family protein 1
MRRSETEFIVEQTHTVVARVQILELAASGCYDPVPVVSTGQLDPGCFQLRQGLQRRIQLSLSSSSGRQLPWSNVSRVALGNIRMLDNSGRLHESSSKQLIDLALAKEQNVQFLPDGTGDLVAEAVWDSSAHDSLMLNRVTAAGYRVLLQLQWWLVVENCVQPIQFSIDVAVATRSRDASSPSKIMTYLTSSKIMPRTWWAFHVRLTPPLTRSATELWRLDTSEKYVRGEEKLGSWRPRGLSLIADYERLTKTERLAADVQAVKAVIAAAPTVMTSTDENPWNEGKDKELMEKALDLWKRGGSVGF